MARKITTRITLAEIQAMAAEDGYRNVGRTTANEIKKAARTGTLLWTTERITTTDSSRLYLRPSR